MAEKKEKRFIKVHTESGGFAGPQTTILVDRKTGVNYLWTTGGYAGGLSLSGLTGLPLCLLTGGTLGGLGGRDLGGNTGLAVHVTVDVVNLIRLGQGLEQYVEFLLGQGLLALDLANALICQQIGQLLALQTHVLCHLVNFELGIECHISS